jgi:hypothetical protein
MSISSSCFVVGIVQQSCPWLDEIDPVGCDRSYYTFCWVVNSSPRLIVCLWI